MTSTAQSHETPTASVTSSTITGWPLTWGDGFSAPTGRDDQPPVCVRSAWMTTAGTGPCSPPPTTPGPSRPSGPSAGIAPRRHRRTRRRIDNHVGRRDRRSHGSPPDSGGPTHRRSHGPTARSHTPRDLLPINQAQRDSPHQHLHEVDGLYRSDAPTHLRRPVSVFRWRTGLVGGPRADGLAAEVLWCHVRYRFG